MKSNMSTNEGFPTVKIIHALKTYNSLLKGGFVMQTFIALCIRLRGWSSLCIGWRGGVLCVSDDEGGVLCVSDGGGGVICESDNEGGVLFVNTNIWE